MRNNTYERGTRRLESFMPEDAGAGDKSSTWDIVSMDEAVDADDPARSDAGTHLKYGKHPHAIDC